MVDLYFAKPRPIVERDGSLIMADDDRLPLEPGETPQMRTVRFRTLGCYPLTGAIESTARTVEEIVAEMLETRLSERSSRIIDHDGDASMEQKNGKDILTPIMNHSDDTSSFYHYGHRLIPERTRK